MGAFIIYVGANGRVNTQIEQLNSKIENLSDQQKIYSDKLDTMTHNYQLMGKNQSDLRDKLTVLGDTLAKHD